jgi:hypothetical protein
MFNSGEYGKSVVLAMADGAVTRSSPLSIRPKHDDCSTMAPLAIKAHSRMARMPQAWRRRIDDFGMFDGIVAISVESFAVGAG